MMAHRTYPKILGFRLGVFVFKDAEIVDYAAPYGVFSVARRFDPELVEAYWFLRFGVPYGAYGLCSACIVSRAAASA